MSVRTIIGGVGAAVGFAIGGPMGAQWGWAVGSIAGNVVDPVTVKGPSIGEIALQTSQEGGPIPIVFGMSPPLTGNVIATSQPSIVKKKSGGKGGPKVVSETAFRTYAIGVCEGPIVGFVRVWRNNILVYDASEEPLVSAEDNAAFLETARFFLGTYTQTPSPDLEAVFGVGTTAAHRGTAYMVMADEDVTDMGGAIPQWQFQVASSGTPSLSNDVLYPWSDSTASPLNSANEHEFAYVINDLNTLGPARETLAQAVADGNAEYSPVGAYTHLVGWSLSRARQLASVYDIDADEREYLSLHYNRYAADGSGEGNYQGLLAVIGSEDLCGIMQEYFSPPVTTVPSERYWWSGEYTMTESDPPTTVHQTSHYGVWRKIPFSGEIEPGELGMTNCIFVEPENYGSILVSPDYFVDVRRTPRGPPGSVKIVGDYKVLQTYAVEAGVVTQYPLNPVLEYGDDLDTQAFWEAAYADAVTAGDMEPGKVYGTDYPVEQGYAWSGASFGGGGSVSLPDVVTSICARAGVASGLVDVTLLSQTVDGLLITNQYPASQSLLALSQIYLFDASAYDTKIHFLPRGANAVDVVTEDDMVEDDEEIEQTVRSDSISIPRVLNLNYYDVDQGGLTSAKQTSERSGDRRNTANTSIQSPVVMSADTAAQAVDIAHKIMIEEAKGELKFSLPDSFLELVASDPIIVQWHGKSERVRIVQLDILDGFQSYVCWRDRQSSYTSDVEGIPPPSPTPPISQTPGETLLMPLDIPLLRDADDNVGMILYVALAGSTSSWAGALVELSYDGGTTYVDSESGSVSAVIGELTSVLEDHPADYPDEHSQVSIRLDSYNSDLEETDLLGMLNRSNLAAVGSPETGWELINFANASEDSNGEWSLSYLLRGRKATTTREHPIGAKFVLLDRTFIAIQPMSVSDIGQTLTIRATSFGAAEGSGTVVSFVYQGWAQIERPVGNLEVRRDGDNVVVSWIGVGRLGAGSSASQGARFTGYRVTVSDGVSEVEESTTEQQATISTLGLGSTLTVTVVQMNELTGAGQPESITGYFPPVGTGGSPPSGEYEIELTGVFDTSQSFEVTVLYQPTSGAAVSVTSRVLGTGKSSFDDMATELESELDAGLPPAVTVDRTGAIVTVETSNGFLTITQKQLVVGVSLQQAQAPLPITSAQLQVLSIDLWTSDASIENGAVGAPDSSTNYRNGGGAAINWRVRGLTWDRDKALGYGLFQNAFWSIPSNTYNYRIQALQDAPAAMMGVLPQYVQSVSYSTGPGQARATLVVQMKPGYSMETTRNWAGMTAGTHPSGYVLEIDELVAGVAEHPSGAKQRVTWSFGGTYDGDGNLHTLEEGQLLQIDLDATTYQHEVTAPEAAAPTSATTVQSIIDDFRTQIELDGDFDVFVYDEDNTAGLMDIERNVSNTPFTYSTSVDTGLTIEVRNV